MAMRRPRIKAAANILNVKRKPKTSAVDAKPSLEIIDVEDETNVPETPQDHDVYEQSQKVDSVQSALTAKEADAITEESSATTQLSDEMTSNIGSTENAQPEQQTTCSTRRPRIRAAANIVASTKRRSKPGLNAQINTSVTEDLKDETNTSKQSDPNSEDGPKVRTNTIEDATSDENSAVQDGVSLDKTSQSEISVGSSPTPTVNDEKSPLLDTSSSEKAKAAVPTSMQQQTASTTRRHRIRAAANVVAATKRRSQPGLNAQTNTKVAEDLKGEAEKPESTDPNNEELPESRTESMEEASETLSEKEMPIDKETKAIVDGVMQGKTNQWETSVESAAMTTLNDEKTPPSDTSSSEKANAGDPTAASTTRRHRIRAAANVIGSTKRRSKPDVPQVTTKLEEDLKVGHNASKQLDGIDDAPGIKVDRDGKASSMLTAENEQILSEDIERLLETAPCTTNLAGKPAFDDSASFKLPSNIEYANHSTATPSNACSEELISSEYDGVLQSDLQKSLLGPPMSPMSPMSPSKVLSRQRIRATPHFGQRRNSFVGSSPSPHTGDDGSPSYDHHPPSSPYHTQRRDRHYSGPNTPFSTMASPALSQGGGSGHYGSPHKYAPLIPSGRIRTESSCSAFSDFVGGQKPRKQDENQARRRDFEARFTNGVPDKATIKMSDLIYYNPVSNPMESKPKMQVKTEARGESVEAKPELKEEKPDEETAMPVPQLKLNADGELILDDTSLEIETTAEQEARKALASSSLIYLDENTGMNGFYKRHKRTKDWEPDETIKFYRCLQTLGTDFSLMCQLFPKRTRRDLKLKFKKEERCNGALINKALLYPKEFNIDELTKQLAQEENEREEAEKRWKSIKAASPKYVRAIKPKNGNGSSASRILNRGENIYDNENIVKGKLGKRALSAQKKKTKTESEVDDTNRDTSAKPKPTRKRKIKEETATKQCEATPDKQRKEAPELMELDDEELSKGISDLLDGPSMGYFDDIVEAVTNCIENEDVNEFDLNSPTKAPNEHGQPQETLVSLETESTSASEEPTIAVIEFVEQPPSTTSLAPVEAEVPLVEISWNPTTTTSSVTDSPSETSSQPSEHTIPLTEDFINSLRTPDTSGMAFTILPVEPSVTASVDSMGSTTTTDSSLQPNVVETSLPPGTLLELPMEIETVTTMDPPTQPYTTEALSSIVLPESMHTITSQPSLITSMPTPVPTCMTGTLPSVITPESTYTIVSPLNYPVPTPMPTFTTESPPCLATAESAPTTDSLPSLITPESTYAIASSLNSPVATPMPTCTTETLPSFITLQSTHTIASPMMTPEPTPVPTATSELLPSLISHESAPTAETLPSMAPKMPTPPRPSSPSVDDPAPSSWRDTPSPSPSTTDDLQPEEAPSPYEEDIPSSPFMEADSENIQAEGSPSTTESHDESVGTPASPTPAPLEKSQTENTQEIEMYDEQPSTSKQTPTESSNIVQETIHKIVTGIVKGTLVLVSTIQPDSEELLNEVYLQDPETEELIGEPLPFPRHIIDQILQMMGDGDDDDDDDSD